MHTIRNNDLGDALQHGRREIVKILRNKVRSIRQIARLIGRSSTLMHQALLPQKNSIQNGDPRKTISADDNFIRIASLEGPFKSVAAIR